MRRYLWICTACNQQGMVSCFDYSDLVKLPDFTLRPSHKKKSPSCQMMDIFLKIEGKFFQVREHNPSLGTDPPFLEVQHPRLVPSKTILKIISWYTRRAPKIVIIESMQETPERRVDRLQRTVQEAEKNSEIIVLEGVPWAADKLRSYEFPLKATDQKYTLVFVGGQFAYETWLGLVKACKKTFLLKRTICFYC